jgi:bifunctional non-homologous end joining protein LigD
MMGRLGCGTVTEAMLYAFDLLELDGVDHRPLPLGKRKERLAHLVDRRLTGIVMNDHTDAIGELVFKQACAMGLDGQPLVLYRAGARRGRLVDMVCSHARRDARVEAFH